MTIAALAAQETPRGADYGNYPENTRFGHTRVSYEDDLSEYNSPEIFIYTNNTSSVPMDARKLERIAGHGSSTIVEYDGTGAYFLDRLPGSNLWRLEVLPDVTLISDPFSETSLNDTKIVTTDTVRNFTINLPALGSDFTIHGLNEANNFQGKATNGTFSATPGAYLLVPAGEQVPSSQELAGVKVAGNIGLTEYVHPQSSRTPISLLAPLKGDTSLDVAMIPEAWDFKISRENPSWEHPAFLYLTSTPKTNGILVIHRHVADLVNRIPSSVQHTH